MGSSKHFLILLAKTSGNSRSNPINCDTHFDQIISDMDI